MLIGMLGLITLALLANMGYYEYRVVKKPKKDVDIMKTYLDLYRSKYGRRF